ncbi:UNVERIFIED_CONTAM: hypothetical protein K2H54_037965 [Gekko kuhli]
MESSSLRISVHPVQMLRSLICLETTDSKRTKINLHLGITPLKIILFLVMSILARSNFQMRTEAVTLCTYMDVSQGTWKYNRLISEQKCVRLVTYYIGSPLVPDLKYQDEILPEVLTAFLTLN